MVYVQINLCLTYRKRKKWLKGNTQMWAVFCDNMGFEDNVKLVLDNMDFNDPMLEPINFDDEPIEGSSSTSVDVASDLGLGEKEKEEEDG